MRAGFIANPSYFVECQEEEAMLELDAVGRWELLPDLVKLIW
jgi:hypothetical protein